MSFKSSTCTPGYDDILYNQTFDSTLLENLEPFQYNVYIAIAIWQEELEVYQERKLLKIRFGLALAGTLVKKTLFGLRNFEMWIPLNIFSI